jgi:signal transduction histidine kinase
MRSPSTIVLQFIKKQKFSLFLLVFLFGFVPSYAQLQEPDLTGKAYDEKLTIWLDYCKKAVRVAAEGKPNFTRLMFIDVAKKGISLSKQDDLKNIAQFQYIVGRSFQEIKKLDSAIFYLEAAFEKYKRIKMHKEEIVAMQFLNYAYYQTGKFTKRDQIINQLKAKLNQPVDLRTKSVMTSILGEYSFNNDAFEAAIKYKMETLKLIEQLLLTKENVRVDSLNLGIVNIQIAETYIKMKQFDRALLYLKIFEKKKTSNIAQITAAKVYNDYIMVYLGLNNLDSANASFNKLKLIAQKEPLLNEEVSVANNNFAEYYLQNKQTDVALKFNKQAQLFAEKNIKLSPKFNENYTQAKLAYAQGKHYDAIAYLNKCLPMAHSLGKIEYANVNRSLALNYEALKDFENSSKYFKLHASLQDTINAEASKKTIAEMDAKYHGTINAQEIKLLNAESSLKSKALKEEKQTRWILIGVAIFATLSTALVYWSYRNKRKANLLLDKKNQELDGVITQLNNANQTKAKLFSIISHDLRSPVSQLFTFLRVQQINPNHISAEQKEVHQKKLMNSASSLLTSMEELLLWSKSQMEHFELDMDEVDISRLFEESIASMQNQADAKNIKTEIGELNLENLKSDHNLLIIVLRNLLQNAINHSFDSSSISLNAIQNDNQQPIISIVNRGAQITAEKIDELLNNHNVKSKSSGYGLLIVKELLEKLDATLRIESIENATTMKIIFK